MFLVVMRMNVPSEKRRELSQTMASLSGSIRVEKGCRRCDFCQSMEDENRLFLLEEWDTRENLMNHLESKQFRVLRGAMNLLREPCERMFHTVFHPDGIERFDGGDCRPQEGAGSTTGRSGSGHRRSKNPRLRKAEGQTIPGPAAPPNARIGRPKGGKPIPGRAEKRVDSTARSRE